ncbi:MAG: nickel pincer cofactor biosynthesis protein LarC [Candidatus Micrarchaeota archaeon]
MLIIVPRSGVSGDMLLSALIDLGADEKVVARTLEQELGVSIRTKNVTRGHARARMLLVSASKKHYTPAQMRSIISKSGISKNTKALSQRILKSIVLAEREAHGVGEIHFHELSHIDTLVDIIGCALALESIGDDDVRVLPLAVGHVAPATLRILTRKRMPFYGGGCSLELTTPTGAAIVTNIAKPVKDIPTIISESVGYGAGTADRGGEPNVLMLIRGAGQVEKENMTILETNLDDVSGEIVAYAAECLMKSGAKDVCVIPIIAKKGRPGSILRIICNREHVDRLVGIMFEETGTLGIRETECSRHIAIRSFTVKKGIHGKVRVKEGRYKGKQIGSKPEFEDLKRLAKKKRKSLREVSNGLR